MASDASTPKKTVFQQARDVWPDNGTDPDPQLPTKRPAMPAQNTMDPETRAEKLAAFARQVQQARKCDWTRAWIQASEEHPELINSDSDGGLSKTQVSAERTVLPGSDPTAVTATFKELPVAGNSL